MERSRRLRGGQFNELTVVLLIGLALFSTAVQGASSPRVNDRIALVIGNSAYRNIPQLANPAKDARGIADVLAADGFQIYGGQPLIDGEKKAMDQAIRGFGRQLKNYSTALFYYAGHGVQLNGINYLVPVDANWQDENDTRYELVTINDVLGFMQTASNSLNILILDACRNNPIGDRDARGRAGVGLAQMTAPRGTFISYATAPGQLAKDGTGNHSPYTLALIETLKVPGLRLFDSFNQVALRVGKDTGGTQEPWVSSSGISSDFFWIPRTTGALELEVAPPEALLSLDGQPMGLANGFRRDVGVGPHDVRITADGYETWVEPVTIGAAIEKSLVIRLRRSENPPPPPPTPRDTGTLAFDVTSPGALLKLDGQTMGAAKGFRQEVKAGSHDYEISAEGYETYRGKVDVVARGEVTRVGELRPIPTAPPQPPPPTTGTLALEVSVPRATLRLDGTSMGLAKGFRRELPEGDHEIEIAAEGYETTKQIVPIAAGVVKSVILPLVPKAHPSLPVPEPSIPAVKSTGWLVVSVDPDTALITIDGRRGGSTGTLREEVAPGEHVVLASGKGLQQQRRSARVDAGETVHLSLRLARVPSAPPPVPREVYNPPSPRPEPMPILPTQSSSPPVQASVPAAAARPSIRQGPPLPPP